VDSGRWSVISKKLFLLTAGDCPPTTVFMRRPERVAEEVREQVIQIVGYELEDPRITPVVVTDVRVANDMRDARVYVTIEGTEREAEEAMKALRHAEQYVRKQVGLALGLRYAPIIHFVRDCIEEQATRAHALLNEISHHKSDEVAPEEKEGSATNKG
jgi:ribosome-binding factor A